MRNRRRIRGGGSAPGIRAERLRRQHAPRLAVDLHLELFRAKIGQRTILRVADRRFDGEDFPSAAERLRWHLLGGGMDRRERGKEHHGMSWPESHEDPL